MFIVQYRRLSPTENVGSDRSIVSRSLVLVLIQFYKNNFYFYFNFIVS